MSTFWQDLHFGLRLAAARPGFTAVAVIALALGIGPNTAIFSIVNSLLLTPPPYDDPGSIVTTAQSPPLRTDGDPPSMPSTDDFQDWRRDTRTLEQMALYASDSLTLTGFDEPVRLTGARVSPALFPLLRVKPLVGRTFTAQEEQPGAAPAVLLSYRVWDQKFGADHSIVGTPIVLDGVGRQVIGIMPEGFEFPARDTEYWTALVLTPPERNPNQRRVMRMPFLARLRPDVTVERAAAEGEAIIARNQPSARRLPLRLVTLRERRSGPLRPALLVLSGAVGLVLLIACANVANLLLSRGAARQRELSIRAAIGAGRGHLVRQMLTESVVLAVLGGLVGLLLAYWAVRLLPPLGGTAFQQLADVRLDLRALAFAAALSLVTAMLFGLAPALALTRGGLAQSLKEGVLQGTAGLRLFGGSRVPRVLTVAQVALSMMLLVGAGLLTRSFVTLVGQNLGYRPSGALTVQFQLPRARYPQLQQRLAFYDQLLDGLRKAPGIDAAGLTNLMPMSRAQIRLSFDLPGLPAPPESNEPPTAGVRLVSPGFLKALGTRLASGRDIGDADRATGEPIVIVNSVMAARYFAGLDPIGRSIDLDVSRRIVGVANAIKPEGLDSEPTAEVLIPIAQSDQLVMEGPLSAMTLVVRSSGTPATIVPAIRTQVSRLDPELPLFNIVTLSQRVSDTVAEPRFYATILGIFAALALVLAAVGIYGVLSSQVVQSTREIGIRMALGAGPAAIRRSVLGHGALLAAVGLALGLGGAWGMSRYLSSLLFGITPFDLATYLGAAVVLAAVAVAGAYLPTRRATGVDPVVALRCE